MEKIVDSIEELSENIFSADDYICCEWTEREKAIVKQQNIILKAMKQINKQMKEK